MAKYGNKKLSEKYTDVNGNEHETTSRKLSEVLKVMMASYNGTPFNKYKLLDDAYRATGMFETGEALIPHPRETADKYQRRKDLSYYINYVKPIVDAHINLIFKNEPVRQGVTSTYEMFMKDVDGNGTSLTRFMKKASIRAKLHGVEFIVIDAPQIDPNTVITQQEFVERRLYPYLYCVSPANVLDYVTDKFGRLVSITYQVDNNTVDSEGNKKDITEIWTLTDSICKKQVDGEEEVYQNNIGAIPVIPVYGTINNSDDLIPQSDMYAIARTNLAIFNACSELRERNRAQAFSLLVYPIGEDDDYTDVEELQIGTASLVLYRTGSQAPEFITPPEDSSDILLEEIQEMVKEIYRMADMQYLQQNYVSNVSGVAISSLNQQLYQSLTELANGLQEAEKKIANIFGLYVGEDLSDFYVVYNKDFTVTDSASVLANATSALAMNISSDFNEQVKRQVIRSMLQDVDNSITNEVLRKFESEPTKGEGIDPNTVSTVQPTAS